MLTALFPEAKWGFLLTGLIGSSQPHPYAAVPAVTVSCKLVARAPSSTFPSRRSITAHKSNANAVQGRPNTAAHSSSCLAAEPTACQPSSGMACVPHPQSQHNCMQPQGYTGSQQQTTQYAADHQMHRSMQHHSSVLFPTASIHNSTKRQQMGIEPPPVCKDHQKPTA